MEGAPAPTSDPPVKAFPVGRRTLAFTDEGPRDAPPVLMIHGLPGSARDFRYLAPLLADTRRVVRIELPGFGGSSFDPAALPFRGRARAVLEIADHLGLGRFVVLGHSMGGGTALVLAAEHAERVLALALVNSVALRTHRAVGMPPAVFRLLALAHRVPGLRDLLLPTTRAQYRRRRFAGADDMSADEFAQHLAAIGATDYGVLRAAVQRPLPPTLVAYALDDPFVQTSVSEELARALPEARVLVFPAGGHNLQKTEAPALAAALKELELR